jgi:hypothetical protein
MITNNNNDDRNADRRQLKTVWKVWRLKARCHCQWLVRRILTSGRGQYKAYSVKASILHVRTEIQWTYRHCLGYISSSWKGVSWGRLQIHFDLGSYNRVLFQIFQKVLPLNLTFADLPEPLLFKKTLVVLVSGTTFTQNMDDSKRSIRPRSSKFQLQPYGHFRSFVLTLRVIA